MRTSRAVHLLAGAALALILGLPAPLDARPRVEQVVPLPPSLNGERAVRPRVSPPLPQRPPAAVAPAPAAEPAAPAPSAVAPARIAPPPAAAAPAATAPLADAQPAAQPPAEPPRPGDSGFNIKGALDRLLAASDSQITDRLRAIVTAKRFETRITRAPERQAMQAFYAARNYAPLWIQDGRLTARAKTLIARLQDAGAEGLDAADYPVPEFDTFTGSEALAEGDITLTNSAMTFARHLMTGRIAPRRVFAQVEYGDHTPEPADILKKLAGAGDIGATLDAFDPPHEGFRAIKRKLAELRSQGEGGIDAQPERIRSGPTIKPGAKDPRVPLLRERLGLKAKPDDITYDRALFRAVVAFQQHHELRPDGIVGSQVIGAINGPKPLNKAQAIDTVLANMERWRWLPRDLGNAYVMVNIPDYTLKVVQDHRLIWRTKIVAGKPQTPTPLTSAWMDSVIVNPSWYVPQSIIQNELLPLYDNDPNIFDRMGLEVKRGPDGHINVVQPPGAANALGRIKFNFPNKFQVYLHDTPEKRLFRLDKRAFSHGCMRVQDPTVFGQIILHLAMNGPTPNSHQLYEMFGRDEHTFRLKKPPMVHLTYQTAFVDDSGRLELRDDIYGFDARIRAILHSGERRVADVAPPPDPKRDADTMKANQEILRRVERREALNPLHFFERLFR